MHARNTTKIFVTTLDKAQRVFFKPANVGWTYRRNVMGLVSRDHQLQPVRFEVETVFRHCQPKFFGFAFSRFTCFLQTWCRNGLLMVLSHSGNKIQSILRVCVCVCVCVHAKLGLEKKVPTKTAAIQKKVAHHTHTDTPAAIISPPSTQTHTHTHTHTPAAIICEKYSQDVQCECIGTHLQNGFSIDRRRATIAPLSQTRWYKNVCVMSR